MAKYQIDTTADEETALTAAVATRNVALASFNPDAAPYTNESYLVEQAHNLLTGYANQAAADTEAQVLEKYRQVPEDGKVAIQATVDAEVAKLPAVAIADVGGRLTP